MRIAMRHPAYKGGAKVLPEHRAAWEAKGWQAEILETTEDEEIEE